MENTTGAPSDLAKKSCAPCEGGAPFSESKIRDALKCVPEWSVQGGALTRQFRFKDYGETTGFVNAVAWIAQSQDHHPEITFGYKAARVSYSTHAVNGLSENDFICAAKVDRLLEGSCRP